MLHSQENSGCFHATGSSTPLRLNLSPTCWHLSPIPGCLSFRLRLNLSSLFHLASSSSCPKCCLPETLHAAIPKKKANQRLGRKHKGVSALRLRQDVGLVPEHISRVCWFMYLAIFNYLSICLLIYINIYIYIYTDSIIMYYSLLQNLVFS